MVAEGIVITRGTKKIIQEAIDMVDTKHQNDRIRLCEAFCQIVERRYSGGALNYQLKRMGNTYPFDLLEKNNWTIQDALDNDLVVYVDEEWFVEGKVVEHDGFFFIERNTCVSALDGTEQSLRQGLDALQNATFVTPDILADYGLSIVAYSETTTKEEIAFTTVFEPVSDELQLALEEKVYWLGGLMMGTENAGSASYMSNEEILNFNMSQAKMKGLLLGKESSVKIPLNTTGPILEAIDKYLYDKTGQYTI